MPVAADNRIIAMNITSQFVRAWLTFHHTMVNSTAQTNSTISRQFPR